MFVLRKTMEQAVEAERERSRQDMLNVAQRYGQALQRAVALQREMSAWVMNKAGNITPEQAAQMFYAQDDTWQAAFFNVMQEQVLAFHASRPPDPYSSGPGVPAGEGQWWHAMSKLTPEGFETIEAMYEHAKYHRDRDSQEAA